MIDIPLNNAQFAHSNDLRVLVLILRRHAIRSYVQDKMLPWRVKAICWAVKFIRWLHIPNQWPQIILNFSKSSIKKVTGGSKCHYNPFPNFHGSDLLTANDFMHLWFADSDPFCGLGNGERVFLFSGKFFHSVPFSWGTRFTSLTAVLPSIRAWKIQP